MRPFVRTITVQLDKLKRDRQVRDRLARDIRADKEKLGKKETDANRLSTQPKKPVKPGHKKGRSVTAFFRVVRPLSTVFGTDKPDLSYADKSLPELDFSAPSKPALSLSLVHATVRVLPNEVRSFTFAVETEDGGRYVLQATSPIDREQWISAITRAAQISAARRSLMEAQAPKLDLENSDWQARPPSQHPKSVYGVNLTTLLERGDSHLTDRGMPLIISQLIEEVERRGLTETGIYRISGSRAVIESIRNNIDKGLPFELVVDEYTDIYAICDAIKQWFRDLPESILPATLLKDFEQALKIEDYNARMFRIQDLVVGLPRANFLCLRGLAEHLYKVTDYEDQNQMHADNLATVWAPTLCRLPNVSQIPIFQVFGVLGPATGIVKQCILQYHWIFNEPDEVEPESAADTELATPTADTPAVEERRFSLTVDDEGALVVQEEPLERSSIDSQASSVRMMPDIEFTGPTPEPSVDSHGEYSAAQYEYEQSFYPVAATSTIIGYP
ncbi:RhoGAP-domain-containing protein [Dacryopinax primogenitus]|uniref:RhoGAP-domain-containing protein n=1 Tax=Dacryopinax primogenitus (strain DJM 731) TaxID=1858805 RepID=M5FUP1_DACPD|nr:RhoGAP-domain-containing protein [Dacryopinax primogenitus]EJT96986.1 RhoGAP-domain-containing protein [Dacryopinax primogenitus]